MFSQSLTFSLQHVRYPRQRLCHLDPLPDPVLDPQLEKREHSLDPQFAQDLDPQFVLEEILESNMKKLLHAKFWEFLD